MISGEELNRVLTCIEAILRSFEEGTQDYTVIDDLKQKLLKKMISHYVGVPWHQASILKISKWQNVKS